MNELLKENLKIIKTLEDKQKIMSYFKFKDDKLYVDNLEIDLTSFDLNAVLNENVLANLEKLDINDLKKLFNIATKKNEVIPPKENLEEEKKTNPKIKNFKIMKKPREDGSYLEYPYYIDENNNLHVLFNYVGTNILSEYQKLFLALGGNVTAKDLYDSLDRKMKNVELTPDYNNQNMSESNKFETELINRQNNSERVLLNQEHEVYSLGNNLYTHNMQSGGLNQNTYNNDKNKQEEATYSDNFDQTSIEIEPEKEEAAKIISLQEYLMLIKYTNQKENPDVGLFESFMEDVMTYQEFVSEDMIKLLREYQYNMDMIQANDLSTNYELEALNRYKEVLDKIEIDRSNLKKDNIQIRTRKLEEEYKNAGFGLIYIVFAGIILITILTIVLLAK